MFRLNSAIDPATVLVTVFFPALFVVEYEAGLVLLACKEVLQQLPMEFAVEAQKLVGISLEGSVG